ncbi:galactose oxidase early set domain-containing protein [Actinomycetospora lutea]|uniref:galactose oxidase early set domain-containing protein n=1 Tax=Actinomycetospora lutea TaxID=663604 RepID=UPI0023663CC3|nr:galactose oxidase early set domain-containing protein [Actinomycetospora lutea]MDD7941205.1 galactose oxidase early set domain-containing protein [Actinomycetospora lutea]
MRPSNTRRVRQVVLVVVAAAVLLGVNVPPAWSYISEWRHEELINSPDYVRQFGHWDTIDVPDPNRVNAIHAALLSTGKVLLIAGSGNKEDMFATRALKSLLYDPSTGQSRMIPVPDDMFCGGQTTLPDGRLLVAGGTQRYEKLDGAVTNAAGTMTVKNEDPNNPMVLPAGTVFVSPTGVRYRADAETALPPAAKTGQGRRTQVTASEEPVFVEAVDPGPAASNENPAQYQVEGLPPAVARNVYGQGQQMTLRKQDYQGTNQAYTFDPVQETWSRVSDMAFHRWYATLTPMSDGRVLTTAGLDGTGEVLNGQTELFDPRTDAFVERKDLTHYFPTYPAIFETDRVGRMVYTGANAGYGPADRGREPGFWDTDTGAFTAIPGLRDPDLLETAGSSFVGPVNDQRMAVVGGGGVGESPRATGRIDYLDMRDPAPHFTPGPSLPEGVRYPNLVNLPDDTTLISGGSRDYRGKGGTNNHIARLLHPDTGELSPAADPAVGRDYHTEAILLPDGRVLTAGSDPLFDDEQNLVPGTFEQRIEIYSPPYLYRGARPTIADAPPTLARDQTATIPTPDAGHVRTARLIKASTATHVTTTDMRSVALDVGPAANGVSVHVPENPALTPPGPYMLFLVDDRGVPSVGRMVSVGPGPRALTD